MFPTNEADVIFERLWVYTIIIKPRAYSWFCVRKWGAGAIVKKQSGDPKENRSTGDPVYHSQAEGYRELVEEMCDWLWATDADGRYTYSSPVVQRILGYTPEEVLGREAFEFITPEYRERCREMFNKAVKNKSEIIRLINANQRKDGSVVYLETSGKPILDKQGNLTGYRGIDRDVTETVVAQEALKANEALLNALVENLPFEFWATDPYGRYVMENSAAKKRWGDVVGYRPLELDIPRDIAECWQEYNRIALSGNVFQGEMHYDYNGEKRTFWNVVAPVSRKGETKGSVGVSIDITQLKQAAESLHESEQKFKRLAESANVAIVIMQNQKLVYVNPCMELVTGYSSDELTTMDPFLLIGPDSREMMRERAKRRLQGQPEPGSYEFELTTKSGDKRWMDTSMTVIEYEGNPAIVGMAYDITDRRKTEEALREEKDRASKYFNIVGVMMVVLDKQGRVCEINEKAQEILGYTGEEIIGLDWFETFIPLEWRSSTRDVFDKLFKSDRSTVETYQNPVLTRSGEERIILWHNSVLYDDRTYATLSSGEDITNRVHAEEALKESEEKFRSIFENSGLGIFQKTMEGNLVLANSAFARMFGYDSPEQMVSAVRDVASELFANQDQRKAVLARASQTSGIVREEVLYRRKDGSTFIGSLTLRAVVGRGKEPRLEGFVEDITVRKQTENALRDSQKRLMDVISFLPDATFAIDLNGNIVIWNRAMEELTGRSAEVMIGKGNYEYSIPFYGRRRSMLVNLVLKPNHELEAKYSFVRTERGALVAESYANHLGLGGRYIWNKASPLYDSEGNVAGAIEAIRDVTEQRMEQQRREEAEAHKREFYRRTILAATEGKLIITDPREIKSIAGPPLETWQIREGGDLSKVRDAVHRVAREAGMDDSRMFDLVLTVGEATTNALKHAGGAVASIHRLPDELIVEAEDHGRGIEALTLPEVALTRGYSTARSLGMGYKAMISLADRVYLATGPTGTVVAIEMKLHPAPKPAVLAGIADTWAD